MLSAVQESPCLFYLLIFSFFAHPTASNGNKQMTFWPPVQTNCKQIQIFLSSLQNGYGPKFDFIPHRVTQCLKCILFSFLLPQTASQHTPLVAILKIVPYWMVDFLVWSGLLGRISSVFSLAVTTHSDMISSLTQNKDLQALSAYLFYGDDPPTHVRVTSTITCKLFLEFLLFFFRRPSKGVQLPDQCPPPSPLQAGCLLPSGRFQRVCLSHHPCHPAGRGRCTGQGPGATRLA